MQFAAEQARRFDLNSKGERSKHGLGSIIAIGAKHTGEPEKFQTQEKSALSLRRDATRFSSFRPVWFTWLSGPSGSSGSSQPLL